MFTFPKSERLNSKKVIDRLFAGGNGSMACYPLRAVWMIVPCSDDAESSTSQSATAIPPVRLLISVPKRRFHHAVDRNRMKRQVREAYRLQKHILWDALQGTGQRIELAFISITDAPESSVKVSKAVRKALVRISEKVEK